MKKKVVAMLIAVSCMITGCAKSRSIDPYAVDSLALAEEQANESQYLSQEADHIQESVSQENTEEKQSSSLMENSIASIDENYMGEDYYSVCTSYSKEEVEDFAEQVITAIINGDNAGLSQMLTYPIRIGGMDYRDADSFCTTVLEFSQDFIDRVSQLETTNLFCNWQGIMLGEGEVWISEVLNDNLDSQGLKVIGINME